MSNNSEMRRGGWITGMMICAVATFGITNTGCDELILSQVVGAIASELENADINFSELGGIDDGGFGEFDDGGFGEFDDGYYDDYDDFDYDDGGYDDNDDSYFSF